MFRRLGWLLRLSAWALALATSLAVLLGRRSPVPERPHQMRRVARPAYHVYEGPLFHTDQTSGHILDLEEGAVAILRPGGSDYFAHAACSPWRDDRGQSHLLGHWKDISGDRDAPTYQALASRVPRRLGLARWTYPDGVVLDRIVIDPPPFGAPCWAPDASDRFLYLSGDGWIYRGTLPGSAGDRALVAESPIPLRWAAPGLERHRLFLLDLHWPADPPWRGLLLASLVDNRGPGGPGPLPQLWWLRLGDDGASIVAAGRLLVAGGGEAEGGSDLDKERHPRTLTGRDGRPLLAFLARVRGRPGYSLLMAAVGFDRGGGVPGIRPASCRQVTADCVCAPPAFSPDGCWVYALIREAAGGRVEPRRYPVAEGD